MATEIVPPKQEALTLWPGLGWLFGMACRSERDCVGFGSRSHQQIPTRVTPTTTWASGLSCPQGSSEIKRGIRDSACNRLRSSVLHGYSHTI